MAKAAKNAMAPMTGVDQVMPEAAPVKTLLCAEALSVLLALPTVLEASLSSTLEAEVTKLFALETVTLASALVITEVSVWIVIILSVEVQVIPFSAFSEVTGAGAKAGSDTLGGLSSSATGAIVGVGAEVVTAGVSAGFCGAGAVVVAAAPGGPLTQGVPARYFFVWT